MAVQAEGTLPPTPHMAQNYETAQANPEIHVLPGNLKDARDAVFPFFWGTDSWSSALHLENVKGPANYASLIGGLACLLKNPNMCTDTYSQRSNELEVKLVPWHTVTKANPILYMVEGLRHGMLGASATSPWTGLAVTGALFGAALALTWWMIGTGYKLRG